MSGEWYAKFRHDEVLLPYQRRWVADEAQIKIAEKSRRTGLTWAEAASAALHAGTAKSAGGGNHFYVGSNKEMAREFIEAVAMWAKAFDQAAGDIQQEVLEDEDKDILVFVVHFASGFKVQALSSNPSNLRGMQGNVTIDEAAFHDKLAEILKAALALTMWGSRVSIISTHNGVDSLFNELIEESRADKKRYSLHRITLDDACDQGLYKAICQITRQSWSAAAEQTWKHNLLNDTATRDDALEGVLLRAQTKRRCLPIAALIESRMVDAPVLRFEASGDFIAWSEPQRQAEIEGWCNAHLKPLLERLNPAQRHAFGEDFGRSGDLTVIAPVALDQALKRSFPFLIELRNMPFKQQEQLLFYLTERLPRFIGGALDARGNGQYLAEQARLKYGEGLIAEVMLSQSWYLDNNAAPQGRL